MLIERGQQRRLPRVRGEDADDEIRQVPLSEHLPGSSVGFRGHVVVTEELAAELDEGRLLFAQSRRRFAQPDHCSGRY